MNRISGSPPNLIFKTVPHIQNQKATRNAGLDNLKVLGAFLVIMLHAAIPYLKIPMPGLAWPVHNSEPSEIVTVVFWGIQCFIMPLFFVLAGFASHTMLGKYGTTEYFQQREKRLLYPLLLAAIVILPIEIYVCTLSWVAEGRYDYIKLYSLKFNGEDQKNLWGLSHLWFLLYLGIYVAIHAWRAGRIQEKGLASSGQTSGGISLAAAGGMAFLLCLCLYLTPRITLGFRHQFLPFVTNLCYYGIWFIIGLQMNRLGLIKKLTAETGKMMCLAGLVMYGLLYPVIKLHLETHEQSYDMIAAASLMIPAYAGMMIFGLIGMANHWRIRNDWLEYLSRASFAVYLLHHPMCIITQIGLHHTGIDPLGKFMLVTTVAVGLSLTIYEVAIRNTVIGDVLYGTAKNKGPAQIPQQEKSLTRAA